MDTNDISDEAQPPLWRRVLDFPLVALLAAIALFIAANALGLLIDRAIPRLSGTLDLALRSGISIVLVLVAYKLLIVRLGERRRDELRLADAPRNVGAGLLLGFLLFCVAVGMAAILDVYNIVGKGSFDSFATDLIAAALVPAFMEELLFRGILFRWIEEFGGSWAALLITSALFGAAHILNPNATWFSSFAIAMEAGVLFGGAYMLTRSLWMPMGLHAAWNFTEGFIFDVPVSGLEEHGLVEAKLSGPELLSGGAFGLEASIVTLVIASAAGIWLIVLAVRRGELMHPRWVRMRAH